VRRQEKVAFACYQFFFSSEEEEEEKQKGKRWRTVWQKILIGGGIKSPLVLVFGKREQQEKREEEEREKEREKKRELTETIRGGKGNPVQVLECSPLLLGYG